MNLAQLTRSLLAPKSTVRKPLTRRCRPQLEGLTDRIAPAVTASVVGNVLIIKATGADADDALYLRPHAQLADQLTLSSTNGGIVNGTANGSFDASGVISIKCDLGEGNDTLDMSLNTVNLTGNISFRGGNGANTFYLNNGTVGGSVSVSNLTNATGVDTTSTNNSTVEGNFTVNNGLGSTTGVLTDLTVRGNLNYTTKSSALIPGNDTIDANLLDVAGNITLALANGTNSFLGIANNVPIKAGGRFAYKGGTGTDTLDFRAGATFGSSATISLGENANSLTADMMANLFVGTKLTVTAGAGIDSINLRSTFVSRVTGAASFNLGNGNNTFSTSGLRAGSLGLTTGTGNDTGTFDNLTVDGAATLKFGAGTNTIKLANTAASTAASTIGGALNLTTGAGADSIQVGASGAVNVSGAAKFTLGTGAAGNGNDGLQINNAQFASTLSIICGAGNDDLSIATALSVNITGKLTVNANVGNDQLALGTFNDFNKIVHLMVVPALNGGAGPGDIVRMFAQFNGGNVLGPPGVTVLPIPAKLTAAGWEGIL